MKAFWPFKLEKIFRFTSILNNKPLRQQAFTLLVGVSIFLAFLGYYALLFDWVQEYRTGVDTHHPVKAAYKTAAQLLYVYLGARFFRNRIGFF